MASGRPTNDEWTPAVTQDNFIFVALAVLLALLALAWAVKQYRLRVWPRTVGRIEDARVQIGGFMPGYSRLTAGKTLWNAVLEYAYTVNGENYRGIHTLGFTSEVRARDYAHQFRKGMLVEVHHSPWRKRRTIIPLPGQDWLAEDEGAAPSER